MAVMTAIEEQPATRQRLAFAKATNLDKDQDPVLMSMCKLLTSLLHVPVAGVGMLNRGSFIHRGIMQPSDWPHAPALAAYPLDSEVLEVKDIEADSRFAELQRQCGARFYASAPLTSSKGQCIGALYVIDSAPRPDGMGTSHVFLDMVRIMARKMEEDYVRAVEVELQRRAREQLLASLDKIRAPISVAEVTAETTKILFANRAWANTIGLGEEPVINSSIWDILTPVGETVEEAQTRFWVSETGKRDFAASFLLRNGRALEAGEEEVLPVHLHFRAANRRAAKVIRKGTMEEAVAKALQPAYFFAMFEEDVQDFVLPEELRGRNSMQTSRSGEKTSRACSSIIDLDDDFVREAARDAGLHMTPTGPSARLSATPGSAAAAARSGPGAQERRLPLERIDSRHASAEMEDAVAGGGSAPGDHARKGCGCTIC